MPGPQSKRPRAKAPAQTSLVLRVPISDTKILNLRPMFMGPEFNLGFFKISPRLGHTPSEIKKTGRTCLWVFRLKSFLRERGGVELNSNNRGYVPPDGARTRTAHPRRHTAAQRSHGGRSCCRCTSDGSGGCFEGAGRSPGVEARRSPHD